MDNVSVVYATRTLTGMLVPGGCATVIYKGKTLSGKIVEMRGKDFTFFIACMFFFQCDK